MALNPKLELFHETFMGGRPVPYAAGGHTLNKLAQKNDPVTGSHPNKVVDQTTLNTSFDSVISGVFDTFFWNTEWFNNDIGSGISSIDIRDGGTDAQCQATLDQFTNLVTWTKLRRRTQQTYWPKMGCYFSSFRDTGALFGTKLSDAGWDTKQAAVDRLFLDDSLPARRVSPFNHLTYLGLSGYWFYRGRGNSDATEVSLWSDMQAEQILPFHSSLKRLGNNGGNTKINVFMWPIGHPGGNYFNGSASYDFWRGALDFLWGYYERGIIGAITVWMSNLTSTPVTHVDYTPGSANVATFNGISNAKIRCKLGGSYGRDTAEFSLVGAADMAEVCQRTQDAINAISEFSDSSAWGATPIVLTWTGTVIRATHASPAPNLPASTEAKLLAPISGGGTDLSAAGLFNVASEAVTTDTPVSLNFTDLFVTPGNTWWDAMKDWADEHAGYLIQGGTLP